MSKSDIAVSVRGLSKSYTIAHEQEKHVTLAETVLSRLKNPLRRAATETFWALKDINFDIKKGDVVGIIGRNGAGKSTLLKILSRITEPTTGRIDLYGRVGSLLEVGTGFHPELTGRENVFLNGAILGMTKAEIRKEFDAIVDFSGVEKFLDTPVKRYSSGMYVRLAFAVAAHLNPEILIVDEVLAVGDAAFQAKCLGKMKDVALGGRTVLFVSHNMAAVLNLCPQAIFLAAGKIAGAGDSSRVVDTYLAQGMNGGTEWRRSTNKRDALLLLERVACAIQGEQPCMRLIIDVRVRSFKRHIPAMLAFDIADPLGNVIMQALPSLTAFIEVGNGNGVQDVSVAIELPPLVPARYDVTVWVGPHNNETFDSVSTCVSFEVMESPTVGRTFPHTPEHGRIVPHSKVLELNGQNPVQAAT